MIRFLHGADFHLDSAFAALPPEKAALRRREQRQILERLARLCQGCDLIFLSGDLFDSAHIYRDTLEALKRCFSAISGQIFIAPGNHDCVLSGSPYLTEPWGDHVHIFTKNQIECIHLENPKCDVYGAGFISSESPDLLKGFHVINPSVPNFMVLHGDLQTDSCYCPITRAEVEASSLDYLALGHIHKPFSEKIGRTLCVYPGCLMGRGFDECGEKGIFCGELAASGCQAEFLPVPSWKYEILTLPAGQDPLASILNALPGDCSRDSYRIVLTGEAEDIRLPELETALDGRFFSLSLQDHTYHRRDLWEHSGENTLRGNFLREMQTRYQAAGEEERLKIVRAVRLVTALMDGREVSL